MTIPPSAPSTAGTPRAAAVAAWIGSVLEYYDFFIYGTAAALVFGRVFFPSHAPAVGTLLALATFGVGYVSRPLGGILLGHIGDRLGRKRALLLSLWLMGGCTVAVGCLPSYAQVGVAAPALLVTLRLLQGLSAGGEQAGSNALCLEHAPDHRRAFYTSFTLSGTQAGQIVATAVFLPVSALPTDQLLSWGWRVPFLGSAVVVAIGYLIRRRLDETPVFEHQVSEASERLPLVALLRDNWRDVLRVVLAALIASVSTIFTVYALSYAVHTVGLAQAPMLWVGVLANLAAVLTIPLWALLADRIGRKPVFIAGSLGSAVLIFGYLGSIASGSYPLIFLTGIVLFGVVYTATSGVWPAFYGEMFNAKVRLSGVAIGTQIGFAISGFLPSIAAAIAGDGRGAWLGVAVFTAALCLLNVLAVAGGRENFRVPTANLGYPTSLAAALPKAPLH